MRLLHSSIILLFSFQFLPFPSHANFSFAFFFCLRTRSSPSDRNSQRERKERKKQENHERTTVRREHESSTAFNKTHYALRRCTRKSFTSKSTVHFATIYSLRKNQPLQKRKRMTRKYLCSVHLNEAITFQHRVLAVCLLRQANSAVVSYNVKH